MASPSFLAIRDFLVDTSESSVIVTAMTAEVYQPLTREMFDWCKLLPYSPGPTPEEYAAQRKHDGEEIIRSIMRWKKCSWNEAVAELKAWGDRSP